MQKADLTTTPATAKDLMQGFRVGDFDVYPREERIIGPDGEIHLEPKVMQVLIMLAGHAGEPVTREQLLNEVWSDTIVGDEVLSRAISLLRSALRDERTNPRYIRTLPRRGYELILRPQLFSDAPEPENRRPCYLLAAVTALAVIIGGWMFTGQQAAPIAVAVIPFTTSSSDTDEALLGDSLADYLISALTRSPQLGIVSRHSSFALRDSTMDVRDIGDLLDADYLVEGALSRQRDKVMLTLSLVAADTGNSLWTEQLRGSAGNIEALQDKALSALSASLRQHLKIKALAPQERKRSPDSDAYRSYLEARYQWSLRGEPRIARAIELLQQAIAQQPDFARAHLALAQSEAVAPLYDSNDNSNESVAAGFSRARASAALALELDPALNAEVAALEGCMAMYEMRWDQAQLLLEASLAEDPNNPLAHYWYSFLLSRFGDFDRALQHIQISARLDPLSAAINNRLALAYLWMNQNENAGRQFQIASSLGFVETIQVKPFLLYALRQRRYQDIERSLLALGNSPVWVSAFIQALSDSEQRPAAAGIIDQAIAAGEIDRNFWFGIWIFLQDPDRAVRDFDSGYKSQDIELLWADESEFLRQDPRFDALLAQVNLAPPK
jgi:DNA-binding winged helix-turn-helix (wHTH) protein/TolB-like protein